ncbi:MAG: acetyl ornithine aminotransferase family protein [Thaumarchaeota archaeon]|nr:acetyl ornithine aminotransferase family protein [Nitrososphaerota archaeon]
MKYANIVVEPPGPKANAVIERAKKTMSLSTGQPFPMVVESASDCIVRDVDGNQYIDFNSGVAVLNVGSTHPRVVEAAYGQLKKFTHYSYADFYYENIISLGERVSSITPGSFDKRVFFGNSGTEVVEAAMKLSRIHTKRPRFFAYTGSFHGRTLGALSLTGSKPVQVKGFSPLVPGVEHVPYPYCYRCPLGLEYPRCGIACADYVKEEYLDKYVPADEVAAMFFEPVQGEGGYVVPPPDYFAKLERILKPYGILFVDDEIQSGIGRTGRWFAVEHFGVVPDMICCAKGLGGGLPIGAMIASSEIMDWGPGSHASTFGGNPVAAAAGLAVLQAVEEQRLLDNARNMGEYMVQRLRELKDRCQIIGDVRGLGLMIGVEFVKDQGSKEYASVEAKKIATKAWKSGLIVLTAGRSSIRLAPPLTINREIADEGLSILEKSVKEVDTEERS